MVFIYYLLSLLFILMQYAHTQTLSESEAINKLIEEMMAKNEKKNSEPIQFTWTNQFMVDPTPQYKLIREDATEEHPEKEDDFELPSSLKILDILTTTTASDLEYSVKRDTQREIKDKEQEKVKDMNYFKATPSTSTKLNIHNQSRMTTPMYNTEDTDNQVMSTVEINEKITIKPVDHEAIYVTKAPGGEIRGRIFSGGLFDAVKMVTTKTSLTPAPKSSTETITPTKTPISRPYSTENSPAPSAPNYTPTSQDDYKYHNELEPTPQDTIKELNSTVSAKKLSVIKAIEDLINSIPNYNNEHDDKGKYDDILKELFPVTKPTEVSRSKVNQMKHAIGSNLFQILGYHKNKLSADSMYKDIATIASLRTMYTKSTTPTTTTPLFSTPISTTPISTSTFPTPTEEAQELIHGNVPNTDDLDNWYRDVHQNTDPNHSVITQTTSPTSLHPDLYLLVDEKNKDLRGYFSLQPDPRTTSKAVSVAATTTTTRKIMPTQSQELLDKADKKVLENKELSQLYSLINSLEKRKSKSKSEHKLNWDKIKKFLGHERVCNCKCKENQTICKVCAATDRVMRELTFEFNNLAKYMSDHCMEIQTFFWMNPSGGKKLRDSVRSIDKSLHDYYKRVRGKCTGRTCKTFATYLDKRHLKLLKQAKVKYPWISTNIT